jgi:hypothetical protein
MYIYPFVQKIHIVAFYPWFYGLFYKDIYEICITFDIQLHQQMQLAVLPIAGICAAHRKQLHIIRYQRYKKTNHY